MLPDIDRREILPRLYELLAEQAKKYTMGESSSIPVDTARELVNSLRYTLGFADVTARDLWAEVEKGRTAIRGKTDSARILWERACLTAPRTENVFYRETLKSIGGFFGRYDVLFFAHMIPCSIDYQLLIPVPESLQGVSYVEEYLRRLLTENHLMRAFDPLPVLEKRCPLYRELCINLCEPVLAEALGTENVVLAAERLCSELGIAYRSYIMEFARGLELRIKAANAEKRGLIL